MDHMQRNQMGTWLRDWAGSKLFSLSADGEVLVQMQGRLQLLRDRSASTHLAKTRCAAMPKTELAELVQRQAAWMGKKLFTLADFSSEGVFLPHTPSLAASVVPLGLSQCAERMP
ncbi:hypothetical protein C1H71_13505 [Iodobacter fluviatilis]|uniref:Uncharacterized protein n=1 Tax=Iodobacter fluviatilis TaxID=537 RepID=A0A7G3GB22_9NEIS|nr:hypothetical protein C1H71_13505 [Iodobacter fluviatilis]